MLINHQSSFLKICSALIFIVIFSPASGQFFDGFKFGPYVGVDLSDRVLVNTESENEFIRLILENRNKMEFSSFAPVVGISIQRQIGKHQFRSGVEYRNFGYAWRTSEMISTGPTSSTMILIETFSRIKYQYLQVPILYQRIFSNSLTIGAGVSVGALVNSNQFTISKIGDNGETKSSNELETDRPSQIAPQLNIGINRPSGKNEIQVELNFQINPFAPIDGPINDICWNTGIRLAYIFKKGAGS